MTGIDLDAASIELAHRRDPRGEIEYRYGDFLSTELPAGSFDLEIAAVAHASKLSLYRYFPSKQELVNAMLTERSERIHSWLERQTADAPPGPDRVLAVFDLLLSWFAEPGYRGCAVVNTVTDTRADPKIAAIARRHLARYRDLLERRLDEAGLAGGPALARQLLLLIEGASVVSVIDGTPEAAHDARAARRLLNLS